MGALLGPPWIAPAQGRTECEQEQTLAPDGADAGDYFGSVAIDGEWAIVGALGDSEAGSGTGSVYFFELTENGWEWQDFDTPSSPDTGEHFGTCVDIKGDRAIATAYLFDDQKGRAQVFSRSGTEWVYEDDLVSDDPSMFEAFGGNQFKLDCAAIAGDLAVVGASEYDTISPQDIDTGAVYIYKRASSTQWDFIVRLTMDDTDDTPDDDDQFGNGVALWGRRLLIGAPGWNNNRGAAYIFEANTAGTEWTFKAKLTPSSPAAGDLFGWSVDVEDDHAIVGAKGGEFASMFARASATSWPEADKVTVANTSTFGDSVSISGSLALVGDSGFVVSADPYHAPGSAWLYTRAINGTYDEVLQFLPGQIDNGDQFGGTVAVDGDEVFVGAIRDEPDSEQSGVHGAIYIYSGVPTCP
jgi:hypothetical protein